MGPRILSSASVDLNLSESEQLLYSCPPDCRAIILDVVLRAFSGPITGGGVDLLCRAETILLKSPVALDGLGEIPGDKMIMPLVVEKRNLMHNGDTLSASVTQAVGDTASCIIDTIGYLTDANGALIAP